MEEKEVSSAVTTGSRLNDKKDKISESPILKTRGITTTTRIKMPGIREKKDELESPGLKPKQSKECVIRNKLLESISKKSND
jgi:hypothetical protein